MPFRYLFICLAVLAGLNVAQAKPYLGGHVAYSGGWTKNRATSAYGHFLSAGFMLGRPTYNQEFEGFGVTGSVGQSAGYVGLEYLSGWSSLYASTGLAIGPHFKIARHPGVGAQLRLFGDAILAFGDVRAIALGTREGFEALALFSVGLGAVSDRDHW